MSYELFEKAAAVNGEFEVIPSKTSIFAKGIVIDNKGYMHYKEKTYIPNIVKLSDLPAELKNLFIENKLPSQLKTEEVEEVKEKKNDNFKKLNDLLFEQLEKLADPDDGIDMSAEIKKANAVCNLADKIIGIADLSLKNEMFQYKKRFPTRKSLYQD